MGTGSFPGVKYGRGVLLTTHPLLVPWSWKSRAISLLTLWATTGPVTGTLYLYFYLELFIISVNIDQLSGFLVISPTCTCIFTNVSALKSIRIERGLRGDVED
jgi:hypothetical protein